MIISAMILNLILSVASNALPFYRDRDARHPMVLQSLLELIVMILKSLQLIQEVIEEPLGGAHRDPDKMAERLKQRLILNLKSLQKLSLDELVKQRQDFWLHPEV